MPVIGIGRACLTISSGISYIEEVVSQVIDGYMKVSSLYDGHYVTDGIDCCDISMVGGELLGQNFTVRRT